MGLLRFPLGSFPTSLSLGFAFFALKAFVVLLRPTREMGIELVIQYVEVSIAQNSVLDEPIVPRFNLEA